MRYRLIDVRLWGDEKFRRLSSLRPSAQALFLYLLTNPQTTSVPGLFRAGAGGMSEEIGWTLEDFHQAFEEVLAQGLVKADFSARLIFIPNAIKYNRPQSPNVVKSWSVIWDELPECELKKFAYQYIKSFLQSMGKTFSEAFEKAITKPLRKTLVNQEQEQEQEQKQEEKKDIVSQNHADDGDKISSSNKKNNCPHDAIIALYHEILPDCLPVMVWNKTRRSLLKQRWREDPAHQDLDWWRGYFMHVRGSKFLTGRIEGLNGKAPFVSSLEWLIRPSNFAKVVEGFYHREVQS